MSDVIKGFIEVTDDEDNKYFYSIDNILSVSRNVIIFKNNTPRYDYAICQENYEEIKKKIKEAAE